MVKCPKCKEDIEHLIFEAQVEHIGRFEVMETSKFHSPEYDTREMDYWSKLKFFCPKCDIFLFRSEKKAIKFLKK